MELSKKVGYIKGLMAGLKISDSTPEGQVLLAMSDLLEEMAEEIEINADIIDNVTAYIDEVEDQCDCLDDYDDYSDIEAEEFDPDEYLSQFETDDGCDCECCGDGEAEEDGLEELDAACEEFEEEAAEEQETDGEPSEEAEEDAHEENSFAENKDLADENSAKSGAQEDDEIVYECQCPICHCSFEISEDGMALGGIQCPQCGSYLEFE
jgi:hypothetical protein